MPLPNLLCNDILEGKWNRNKYRVVKRLGEGGIGTVYKVISLANNKKYALKLSEHNISLNREYNILKELEQIASVVTPYKIDDVIINKKTYYFIVMEYINGITLNSYRRKKRVKTTEALYITIVLLKFMGEIHKKGYILGDTKLDNIMITNKKEIKFIDLGGVVKKGSTIKEFTPAYDRASWGCGYRISEPSYDLFSATMILIQLLLKININPKRQKLDNIKERLNKKLANSTLKYTIITVLNGEKKDIKNFANTLLTLYNKERIKEKNVNKANINYKINLFFVSSLLLFIFTAWLIFIKK